MKKFLLGMMMLGLAISCGKGQSTESNNTIKVGMECGYAPFNWFQNDDKNGGVKIDGGYCGGYDVEIAKEIAKGLGKDLVIVKSEWDALLGPAVNSGVVDLVIAGMTATPERKQSLLFTKPYYDSDIVLVVRKDGKYANAKSLQDFAGAKVTGQLNTFHYTLIDQINGVNKQTAMENFPSMIVALNSKKIDAYVAERPGAMADTLANPELTYIEFEQGKGFTYDKDLASVSVAMKLGNDELANKINKILEGLTPEKRKEIMEQAIKNQPLNN